MKAPFLSGPLSIRPMDESHIENCYRHSLDISLRVRWGLVNNKSLRSTLRLVRMIPLSMSIPIACADHAIN